MFFRVFRSVCVCSGGVHPGRPLPRSANAIRVCQFYFIQYVLVLKKRWVELPSFQLIGLSIIAFLGFGVDSVCWSDSVNQTKRCRIYKCYMTSTCKWAFYVITKFITFFRFLFSFWEFVYGSTRETNIYFHECKMTWSRKHRCWA